VIHHCSLHSQETRT